MARKRSVESRITEHRRFREQCRRRIRPSVTLFIIAVVAVIAWVCFLPTSWWIAGGVLAFSGGHVLMEIVSYRYHDRRLRELANENVA
jgi:fatty acid desaturase